MTRRIILILIFIFVIVDVVGIIFIKRDKDKVSKKIEIRSDKVLDLGIISPDTGKAKPDSAEVVALVEPKEKVEEVKKEVVKIVKKEIPKKEIPKTEKKDIEEQIKKEVAKEEIIKPVEKEISLTEDATDIEEINGLIIEKTMTRIGSEFYERFFILWKAPQNIRGYNIHIDEKASPLWGSLIAVSVNNNLVWNQMLRPRSEEIEEAVNDAIKVVTDYLQRYEEIQKQLKGVDMIGTGIY